MENLSIKTMNKYFASNLLFHGSIEQNYVSNNFNLIFLVALYSPKNDNKQSPQKLLYCNISFSWFWTHFDNRPKILTYHQIPPNSFYLRLSDENKTKSSTE